MTRWARVLGFCGLIMIPVAANAADLNVPSTFEDSMGMPTDDSWTALLGGPAADAGEGGVGDHALNYVTASMFHFLNNQSPQFLGDYSAVTKVEFKARHSGQGDDLALRAYLFSGNFAGGGDHAISSQVINIASTDTDWQTYTVDITASDLTLIQGSVASLLNDVTHLGFRHDPSGVGATVPSSLPNGADVYFDDVVLRGVPEPTAAMSAVLALVGLAVLRLRSKLRSAD